MMAACYTMDLYCDVLEPGDGITGATDHSISTKHTYQMFPHQFTGETLGQCKRQARKIGWLFKKNGTHVCPNHSGKKRKV